MPNHATLAACLALHLALPAVVLASSTPGREPARESGQTQRKEETANYYKKWLDQDVLYIITPEERQVFLGLSNDDERDNFIEQFWNRRDSDPSTAENEYKIEYYRRILYSNENFSAGLPGWKTDRGRIYIMFGPPDRIESMPAGGSYVRERKDGGGETSVFPFETWEYRHIEGIGDDIQLEFVDDAGGGLYQLTYDPQRKDELIHNGFLGPTLDEIQQLEETGVANKQYRVAGRRFAGDQAGPYRFAGNFETEKDRPFSKLMLSKAINTPPPVKFKDLEAIVNTSIRYNNLPFLVQASTFQVLGAQQLVTVAVEIPHAALTFKPKGENYAASVEVFGQISTLGKRIDRVFEELIERQIDKDDYQRQLRTSSVFQKQLLVKPGIYKLSLVVKDVESGQLGTWEERLEVPETPESRLAISSLLLAEDIRGVDPGKETLFQLGRLKVIPRISKSFGLDEDLGFYFQIYNFLSDQAAGKPDLQVEFSLTPEGAAPRWRDCSKLVFPAGSYATVARMSSLAGLEPGAYKLVVRVKDKISGQTVESNARFSLTPPRKAL